MLQSLRIEDHPPTPQRQHQRKQQSRVIQREGERSDEHRSAGQDAEPADDVGRVLPRSTVGAEASSRTAD